MSSTRYDAIIVGAGLAGLSAAVWLKRIGYNILVIDKSDDIGGKLRSDIVDGYTLDRGFQVFLTAYPEAKRILQYNELGLKDFSPGAVLLHEGKKVVLHDPFKNPSKCLNAFFKLATIGDNFDFFN
jgi:phytoene dehydrogenase-like protein